VYHRLQYKYSQKKKNEKKKKKKKKKKKIETTLGPYKILPIFLLQ